MRATEDVAAWDVVRPERASQVAGVSMAGFRSWDECAVDVRAVPHPAVTVVLEFGDGPLVGDNGRWQRGNLVARLAFGGVRVRGENVECVQVRLAPPVAYSLFGEWEPGQAVVALDDLWGRPATRMGEQLRAAQSWQDRFALVDAVLAHRRELGPSVDPEVAWVWDRITASRGQARVEELAAKVGWSRKRLWSRFSAQIGLPPKRAARLIRFDHAAHRLAAGEGTAHVAAEAGYVDQSHLHKDVLAFTGVTPAAMTTDTWLAVDEIAWRTFVQDPTPVGARG